MHAVMSRIHLVCVLLFLGSLIAPSVVAADDGLHSQVVRSVKDEIQNLTDEFGDAYNYNDTDSMKSLLHPEVYLALARVPLINGSEAVTEALKMRGNPLAPAKVDYIKVEPNEEGAEYVYVFSTVRWSDQEGTVMFEMTVLFIWADTEEGYKLFFLMANPNE